MNITNILRKSGEITSTAGGITSTAGGITSTASRRTSTVPIEELVQCQWKK